MAFTVKQGGLPNSWIKCLFCFCVLKIGAITSPKCCTLTPRLIHYIDAWTGGRPWGEMAVLLQGCWHFCQIFPSNSQVCWLLVFATLWHQLQFCPIYTGFVFLTMGDCAFQQKCRVAANTLLAIGHCFRWLSNEIYHFTKLPMV